MDDRDEQLHDYIREEVGKDPRLISSLVQCSNFADKEIPEIRPILEFFTCTICMDPVTEPTVIKHCLHFFCKNCVETAIRQL